jgi:DNA helicase II / ATP-dependent DNA helicase PcrA
VTPSPASAGPAGLSRGQREALDHPGTPLLVTGPPGAGKTEVLIRRLAWLTRRRGADGAGGVLLLAHGEQAADRLRERAEAALREPHEAVWVQSVREFSARLLADEALAGGLEPFIQASTPADRVAMLLDRVEELDLRQHEFGGRPAALLAGFVRRIDRCKDELIDAAAFARASAGRADGGGPREREFAAVFLAHDRMLAERGTLDGGDLLLRAAGLLGRDPAVGRRAVGRWPELLVDDWPAVSTAEREVIRRLVLAGARLIATGEDGGPEANPLGFGDPHPGGATVALEQSFRCPELVLLAAHGVRGAAGDADAARDSGGGLDGVAGVTRDAAGGRTPGAVAGVTRVAAADGTLEAAAALTLEAAAGGADPRHAPRAAGPPAVRFWRAANERTQAQSVAAELERLISHERIPPERLAVLVGSVADDGQAVAVALAERDVPYRVLGTDAFFERVEIRDVLAWLRLLVDPRDAGAVARALARPPVELSSVDIARCVQIGRRRKLDMVSALVAATESPQLPPEARERIQGFLRLHRSAAAALDNSRPDLFVHRLIDRLGLRRQLLFTARADVVERLVNLAKLGELATAHARRSPRSTPREFARYIAALADAGLGEEEAIGGGMPGTVGVLAIDAAGGLEFDHVFVLGLDAGRVPGGVAAGEETAPKDRQDGLPDAGAPADRARRRLAVAITRARVGVVLSYPASSRRLARLVPSPLVEDARAAVGGVWEDCEEELFGPAEALHSTFRELRDELLDSILRIGGRLGELRLDTDLDIAHGSVRFLELVKLAALLQRPDGAPIDAAGLADINARLAQAATPLEREILESSPLDDDLLAGERDQRRRAARTAAREEPSLEPFLPRRGDGLVLSASDIETYRTCPLKYKFARVLRIPQEPTLNQRFGILVHQVLERYHATGASTDDQILGLLDAGWRRGGFTESDQERQLREKARVAVLRYRERLTGEPGAGVPRWFERSFAFPIGPHHIRGRVDRVDELPGGGFGLIDFKTGLPKTVDELRDDVQLALYAVAAREAWEIPATERTYYYVLDDELVTVPDTAGAIESVRDTVAEVGAGILGQGFEPTPSPAACGFCDFRIACPVAER